MKRLAFTTLFSLLFSFLPLGSLASAYGETITVRLDNYHGDALELYGKYAYTILLRGNSVITTTGEYGIKTDARRLTFKNDNADGSLASLTINVDSTTSVANGILSTDGDIDLGQDLELDLNISSTLPTDETSTSTVTGLTTPLSRSIETTTRTFLNIHNPTGNFGIYTGYFIASQLVDGVDLGFHSFLSLTHKTTDGYGDAFFYNDFEGSFAAGIGQHVIIEQPNFTFIHEQLRGSSRFRILPSVTGVSANFDDTLTVGEALTAATIRIKSSLIKEASPASYATMGCTLAPYFCPYNPDQFTINLDGTSIVLADDYQAGTYHEAEGTEVIAGKPYALKLHFTTEVDDLAFSKIDNVGPHAFALLNGTESYRLTERPSRIYEGPRSIYILAPLTLLAPEVEETIEEDPIEEPEPEEEIEIVLPKAPNTGRAGR